MRATASISPPDDRGKQTITMIVDPSWLGRLFGAQPQELCFVGECTVWRQLPNYERPGTPWEGVLARIWDRARHEGPFRDWPMRWGWLDELGA